MPMRQFSHSIRISINGAVNVIKDTLKILKSRPEIAAYPYVATLFVVITYPLVSATIFAHWYKDIFTQTGVIVPNRAHAILGLVGFSAFYVALVSTYFTCAVSASVIAKLENRPMPPAYGLLRVIKNFFRVTRFALLSVFFFPVGIYAQRRNLRNNFIGVIGSSLTLHMAQVAPSILTTNHKFGATLRDSIDSLGRAWRESLVLKIGMYISIFLILILPKLIQQGLFQSHNASNIGWIVSIEFGASGLVAFKVLNSIFTAVLYHQAKHGRGERT